MSPSLEIRSADAAIGSPALLTVPLERSDGDASALSHLCSVLSPAGERSYGEEEEGALFYSTCCEELDWGAHLPASLQLRLVDSGALLAFGVVQALESPDGTCGYEEAGLRRLRLACEQSSSGWELIAAAVRPEDAALRLPLAEVYSA